MLPPFTANDTADNTFQSVLILPVHEGIWIDVYVCSRSRMPFELGRGCWIFMWYIYYFRFAWNRCYCCSGCCCCCRYFVGFGWVFVRSLCKLVNVLLSFSVQLSDQTRSFKNHTHLNCVPNKSNFNKHTHIMYVCIPHLRVFLAMSFRFYFYDNEWNAIPKSKTARLYFPNYGLKWENCDVRTHTQPEWVEAKN